LIFFSHIFSTSASQTRSSSISRCFSSSFSWRRYCRYRRSSSRSSRYRCRIYYYSDYDCLGLSWVNISYIWTAIHIIINLFTFGGKCWLAFIWKLILIWEEYTTCSLQRYKLY
jgi:hypothetical protein